MDALSDAAAVARAGQYAAQCARTRGALEGTLDVECQTSGEPRGRVRALARALEGAACAAAGRASARFAFFDLSPWNGSGVADLAALPPRARSRPHVVFLNGLLRCGAGPFGGEPAPACPAPWPAILARPDVMWFNNDLRDHTLFDDHGAWAAVAAGAGGTQFSPKFLDERWGAWDGGAPARWAVSFAGTCDRVRFRGWRKPRQILRRLFQRTAAAATRSVAFRCNGKDEGFAVGLPANGPAPRPGARAADRQFAELLRDSNFSLVVEGHQRFSHRFVEAVGACSVPVVVADGVTLPCEDVVDLEDLVVRVPLSALETMESVDDLLDALPWRDVFERRHRLCAINDLYFRGRAHRYSCLALAALKRAPASDDDVSPAKEPRREAVKPIAVLVAGQARTLNASAVQWEIYATMVAPVRQEADVYLLLDPHVSRKPRRYPEEKIYDDGHPLTPDVLRLLAPVAVAWGHANDRNCPAKCKPTCS